MTVYKRNDEWGDTWRYRKQVTLPNGEKVRVAGTPAINSREEAEVAEREHVQRTLDEVRGTPSTSTMPSGVFKRGNKLWIRFKDATGTWRSLPSGFAVGQEAQAADLLTDAKAEAALVLGALIATQDRDEIDANTGARPQQQPNGRWRIQWIDENGKRQSDVFVDRDLAERALRERVREREESRISNDSRGSASAQLRSGSWRIRWIDAAGNRQSATFKTEDEANAALARHKTAAEAQRTQPIGAPIRFRVIAVYSNGAERDLTAVDVVEAVEPYSDRGVGFATDDEEFAVFVVRRPVTAADDTWQPESHIPNAELPF